MEKGRSVKKIVLGGWERWGGGAFICIKSDLILLYTPSNLQSTATLIRTQDPKIPLMLRGEMEVKGKGLMVCWPPVDTACLCFS